MSPKDLIYHDSTIPKAWRWKMWETLFQPKPTNRVSYLRKKQPGSHKTIFLRRNMLEVPMDEAYKQEDNCCLKKKKKL